jgi:hypothetical protein
MTVYVLFVYDNDESNTGYVAGVFATFNKAEDQGHHVTKNTDVEYYITSQHLL